jgi:hypothetical protein
MQDRKYKSADEGRQLMNASIHERANPRNKIHPHPTTTVKEPSAALFARGRLAEARKWFTYLGWDVLPQGIRGQRILSWGADHAYLASAANPTQSVRRWCRRWAPWLREAELAELVAHTVDSNKRWSADQCAAVLEITVRDREALHLRFIGADDDPSHELRFSVKREKAAARSRRYRAVNRSGRPRGRPKSEGPKPHEISGKSKSTYYRQLKKAAMSETENETKNASAVLESSYIADGISVSHDESQPWLVLGISKATYYRRRKARETQGETKNASRHINNIGSVTEFSVTDLSHGEDSRAPQAPRRQALPVLNGEIILDRPGDVACRALPLTSHTQRAMAFVAGSRWKAAYEYRLHEH